MKNLFKEAHKMTREMMKKYNDIDYSAQFTLCLEYLKEEEEEQLWKATEFKGTMMYGLTRKQAGVIFAAYKRGDLKVSEEYIQYMYKHIAERKSLRNNANDESMLRSVHLGLSYIFRGYYKKAAETLTKAWEFDLIHNTYVD